MAFLSPVSFEAFAASAHAPTDVEWEALLEEFPEPPAPREAFTFFTGDGFCFHERDGKLWVHAWWYAPHEAASREAAVKTLFAWRAEFV